MRRIAIYIIRYMLMLLLVASTWTACDVHELPDPPERLGMKLRLEFDTHMGEQDWFFTRGSVVTRFYDTHDMRYIIRAYHLSEDNRVGSTYEQFNYYRPIRTVGDDYTMEDEINLPAGRYRFLAWADFVERGSVKDLYYTPSSFNSITLYGSHKANTDYRDAFRGMADTTIVSSIVEHAAGTLVVPMERPLAKYTFVTTDLQEFIDKETRLMAVRGEQIDSTRAQHIVAEDSTRVNTRGLNLDDYKVVFYYPMYMPSTYNIFTDKPVDSSTGIQYESKLTVLNNDEARMGFDYVMVNGSDAKVTLRVGLFDKHGNQISMSEPFDVPLNRSMNTIVRGKFLMLDAQGGVSIDPSFDNDHNIKIE